MDESLLFQGPFVYLEHHLKTMQYKQTFQCGVYVSVPSHASARPRDFMGLPCIGQKFLVWSDDKPLLFQKMKTSITTSITIITSMK